MVQSLKNKGDENPPKRVEIKSQQVNSCELNDFVTSKSNVLFQKLKLPDGFLKNDPITWNSDLNFQKALLIVKELKIVNDHAEQGVALIQEYCGLLTRDEDQLQYLSQVIQQHRSEFPNSKKSTLM